MPKMSVDGLVSLTRPGVFVRVIILVLVVGVPTKDVG